MEVGLECEWISVAHVRDRWWAPVSTAVTFGSHKSCERFDRLRLLFAYQQGGFPRDVIALSSPCRPVLAEKVVCRPFVTPLAADRPSSVITRHSSHRHTHNVGESWPTLRPRQIIA
jgi:hypothetical protein